MKKRPLQFLMLVGMLLLCFSPTSAQDTLRPLHRMISENKPAANGSAITLRAGQTFNVGALAPAANERRGADYAIQVGAFAIRNNALRMQRRLIADGYRADVYEDYLNGKDLLYLVWAGSFDSREEAIRQMGAIRSTYHIDGLLMKRSGSRKD